MKQPKRKFPNAATVIRDGVRQKQHDSVIRSRVKRAFPNYGSLDKVLRWARQHPEWVRGEYGKQNGVTKTKRGT